MTVFDQACPIIVSFPPYAGGKFLMNCLSLSRCACPQDPVAARYLLRHPDDYEYRMRTIMSTLPTRDSMTEWRKKEFGDVQLYGTAFFAWCKGISKSPNHTTQLLGKSNMRFFLTDHSMEPTQLAGLWSSALILRLVNSRSWQDLCLSLKTVDTLDRDRINGNYCREKYEMLAGQDWPTWQEFDRKGYDILKFEQLRTDVIEEIKKFYRLHQLNNPVILFDVDSCYFDKDRFMTAVQMLYQEFDLPDFQIDLVTQFYHSYTRLHLQ